MNFTPKINVSPLVHGILTAAVMGLIAWAIHVAPKVTSIATTRDTPVAPEAFQASNGAPVVPAVLRTPAPGFQTARLEYVSWITSKHWWKRNAPIVGGAGGGALIGGLAGGGTGALIGGAVGAGGGYAYKRYHHHHYHHYHH